MGKHENRTIRVEPLEIRATEEDGQHFITARVVNYNVVDDYNTRFVPGVFKESLSVRLPRLCWGHSWTDPIGVGVEFTDGTDGLDVKFRLDDFDAVPRAKQAFYQTQGENPTMDQFSVGFFRLADKQGEDGVTDILQAQLDEVSIVLVGAVPGTKILAVRDARGTETLDVVDKDLVVQLVKDVGEGTLTLEEALSKLEVDPDDEDKDDDDKADEEEEKDDDPDAQVVEDTVSPEELAALEAEADALLNSI